MAANQVPTTQEPAPAEPKRPTMSRRARLLFFLLAWLIVLMPFLFWRSTWFGRPLSDREIQQYLHDNAKPRNTQHALVQIGERISRKDPSATKFYPELIRLGSSPVEEIRTTDAWVMGQDPTHQEFRPVLLKMLQDGSPMVRGNAALALVSFGDASGHDQIVSLLQPAVVNAPQAGKVTDTAGVGTSIHQQGMIAKLRSGANTIEVRSPISGRVRSLAVNTGDEVSAGLEIATIDPGTEQVWEALRALYLIGRPEDLSAVAAYARPLPDLPNRVREQAVLTEKAIRQRAGK